MSLYKELYDLQQGRCGMCGDVASLVVDHDHTTGFIRGLLCRSCNIQEGQHNCANRAVCCTVCTWRRTPAVCWLGRTERYDSSFPNWSNRDAWLSPWAPSTDLVDDNDRWANDRRHLIEGLYS